MALFRRVEASGVVGGGFVDEDVAVAGRFGEVRGVRGVAEVDQFASLEGLAGEFGLEEEGEGGVERGQGRG